MILGLRVHRYGHAGCREGLGLRLEFAVVSRVGYSIVGLKGRDSTEPRP